MYAHQESEEIPYEDDAILIVADNMFYKDHNHYNSDTWTEILSLDLNNHHKL